MAFFDSDSAMTGFSTGALCKGDFHSALEFVNRLNVQVVELSALRLDELKPLANALPALYRPDYAHVSFHVPSAFSEAEETEVIGILEGLVEFHIPFVIHPDAIRNVAAWKGLEPLLLIENMDCRKPTGRTARELEPWFEAFPEAGLCFDIGHARQMDPTMKVAREILSEWGERLAEIHISEVDPSGRHRALSDQAIGDFQSVAHLIPDRIPAIVEAPVTFSMAALELERSCRALGRAVHSVEEPAG